MGLDFTQIRCCVFLSSSFGWRPGVNRLFRFTLIIKIKLVESGSSFRTSHVANYILLALLPKRRTDIAGYPEVASYNMLGDQLYCVNLLKHRHPDSLVAASEVAHAGFMKRT